MSPHSYTREFCEPQYNARASIPDHPAIFARWKQKSELARSNLNCELDLAYGAHPMEKLDLFRAPAGAPAPLFVFIHGGYWRSLDKADFSFIAPALTQAGAHVALVNYELCPRATLPEIMHQTAAALAWIARNAQRMGLDATRIYVGGHSAGGHLAAALLTLDWPVVAPDLPRDFIRGVVAVSGLYELEPLLHTSINDDVRMDLSMAHACSPALKRPTLRAPIRLVVGGQESAEFKRQVQELQRAWSGFPIQEIAMPEANHLTVVEGFSTPDSPLFRGTLGLMELAA